MDKLIAKAEVLLEALPYMQRFRGKIIVIKYGGNAMIDEALKSGFAEDVVLLKSLGLNPVIVHGGGPQIAANLKRHGIETHFVRGLRVTDAPTMEIVEMVLGAHINKQIVALIQSHGGKAVGLTGKDGNLLVAEKMKVRVAEEGKRAVMVDVGLVGRVKKVNPEVIEKILGTDFIPVIAPIGTDGKGNTYNINADTAAAEVAEALRAEKLILLTDVAGIKDGSGKVQPFLDIPTAKKQIRAGSIDGGMVPKVECAITALETGVSQVHIIDGRVSHAVLLEIFTRHGVGTEVVSRLTARKTRGAARK
jgi:acetylglutamate kinase